MKTIKSLIGSIGLVTLIGCTTLSGSYRNNSSLIRTSGADIEKRQVVDNLMKDIEEDVRFLNLKVEYFNLDAYEMFMERLYQKLEHKI